MTEDRKLWITFTCERCGLEEIPRGAAERHVEQCRIANPDCSVCGEPVRDGSDETNYEPPLHATCWADVVAGHV